MKPLGNLELWFVAGTQELYGSAAIGAVEEHVREVAAALDAAPEMPVRVRELGAARSPESIRSLCLNANADDACVGLVV